MILRNNKKFLFYCILLYAIFATISISFSETFYFLAVLYFLFFFKIRWKNDPFVKYVIYLIIYALLARFLTAIFSGYFVHSVIKIKEPLLFLGFFPLFMIFSKNEKLIFIKALIYAMAIITTYAIILHIIKHIPFDLKHRLSTTTSGYMTYGSMVTVAILLNFYFLLKKFDMLFFFTFLINLMGLLLSFTRSGYIGFMVGIILMLILYKPKSLLYILVLIIIVFLLLPNLVKKRIDSMFNKKNSTIERRLEMWKWGFYQFKKHPITGIGPNMVKIIKKSDSKYLSKHAKSDMVHLHNVPIHLLTTMGIFGIIFYLFFLFITIILPIKFFPLYKNLHNITIFSILIALIVIGFFEYNLFDSEITMLYAFILGLFEKNEKK